MGTPPAPDPSGSITRLIHHLQAGPPGPGDEAAQRVWERYLPRLLALARAHLDPRIRALHDEEDVAQSMGRTFFKRLGRGDFDLADRDALWALLVAITLNKARDAADRHFAARRDVRRGRALPQPGEDWPDAPVGPLDFQDTDPTPAEAAELNEALERRLGDLPEPDLKRVALMKLEGCSNREIAEVLACSERGVERKLRLIRRRWEAAPEDPR